MAEKLVGLAACLCDYGDSLEDERVLTLILFCSVFINDLNEGIYNIHHICREVQIGRETDDKCKKITNSWNYGFKAT